MATFNRCNPDYERRAEKKMLEFYLRPQEIRAFYFHPELADSDISALSDMFVSVEKNQNSGCSKNTILCRYFRLLVGLNVEQFNIREFGLKQFFDFWF